MTDENGKAAHCVFQGRDSSYAVKSSQFVDPTGELSVLRRAGGKYKGKDDVMSFLYRMGNVDIDKIIDYIEENPNNYSEKQDIQTTLEDTVKSWREYRVFHLSHGG